MGKIHYKWWFSIVMLVYQRVSDFKWRTCQDGNPLVGPTRYPSAHCQGQHCLTWDVQLLALFRDVLGIWSPESAGHYRRIDTLVIHHCVQHGLGQQRSPHQIGRQEHWWRCGKNVAQTSSGHIRPFVSQDVGVSMGFTKWGIPTMGFYTDLDDLGVPPFRKHLMCGHFPTPPFSASLAH